MSMTHQRKREKEKAAARRRIARMEVTLNLGLFGVPDFKPRFIRSTRLQT